MAAYHFRAKIHSRGKGASAVRAAAYRAGERLFDARLGVPADYTRKADVAESVILLPAGAPTWMKDRERLWNAVEAREKRKDAQVAQEIELNLPRELSAADNWALVLAFAREHLVSAGRVCDIGMHIHDGGDGEAHPHAHILMPLRAVTADGFGEKHPDCDWRKFLDRRDRLGELRALWGDFAREYAAQLGYDLGPDWDHRSYEAREIDLEPQPKIGGKARRLDQQGMAAERTDAVLDAQQRNGERLLASPEIVLDALTQRQSTFTERDLVRWIHRHSTDEQFAGIYAAARARMVPVGRDDQDRERFSTAELITLEQEMVATTGTLAGRQNHRVHLRRANAAIEACGLSDAQRDAAKHLLDSGDLACLTGFAGSGKSTLLRAVRQALEAEGYRVRGAALSGIAAEGLRKGSEIAEVSTIASLRHRWAREKDQLAKGDVLIIDEAGMVGSRELAALTSEAEQAGAKVILVGDPAQLQAIEAGAAYRAIASRCGAAELTEIRRQLVDWQRTATKELAEGDMLAALARYRAAGAIHTAESDAEARALLVGQWAEARKGRPELSRIMLAHTRADVRALNELARAGLREAGELGEDVRFETARGDREFATGDRFLFLRNERTMGVSNGTTGTVREIVDGRISVQTDDGRIIEVDARSYSDFDHAFATTVHKSQGMTLDAAHVLATSGFDRHLAYVSMSRHRSELTVVHSREAFGSEMALANVLGRDRQKDTTLDYWETSTQLEPAPERPRERAVDLLRQAGQRAQEKPRPRERERGNEGYER